MKLLQCRPVIHEYDAIVSFVEAMVFCPQDLIVSNRYIFDASKYETNGASVIYQEQYGSGEPDEAMLEGILAAVHTPYMRVIGIGGGTVLDLAKLLALSSIEPIHDLFSGKLPAVKAHRLVLVPTTCGTGSEVTNISVLAFKALNTKMGLAIDALFADEAVLVPEFMNGLPYSVFALSSLDALIHAVESFLSPKATAFTRLFSERAITGLLAGYRKIVADGEDARYGLLPDFLRAATMAGIAFANAGCGAVHAMSYPLGNECHLPHGEANYALFTAVLRFYEGQPRQENLFELKKVLGAAMDCPGKDALDELERLLEKIRVRKPLAAYGVTEERIGIFADSVIKKQQRLMANAMVPMDAGNVRDVYRSVL